MDKKASDFSVDSKGYCFLCLNKIPLHLHDPTIHPSSGYSLHDLSRYLKVDMRKVFFDKGPIPPHLLARVEKSKLKVELCEDCTFTTERVSKLCRQLENLKMEIESGVETIHEKMSEADKTGRSEQFRGVAGSKRDTGMGGCLEIFEVLRMETMENCSLMISAASPRLQIQRISTEEIRGRTFRAPAPIKETETTPEQMLYSGLQHQNDFKLEEPDRVNLPSEDEDGDHSKTPFVDDLDDSLEISTSEIGNTGSENRLMRAASTKVVETIEMKTATNQPRKWTINPATGKYKCQLCTMEYGSVMGVHYHCNKVHRKIRIKCEICGKEFTQKSDYKRHHESVHLGIRFQCKICGKMFSLKKHLVTHQRIGRCGIGIGQNDN